MAYQADNPLLRYLARVLFYVISVLLLLTASKIHKHHQDLPTMMYSNIMLYGLCVFAHIRGYAFKM